MKLTKNYLKQLIAEELQNEASFTSSEETDPSTGQKYTKITSNKEKNPFILANQIGVSFTKIHNNLKGSLDAQKVSEARSAASDLLGAVRDIIEVLSPEKGSKIVASIQTHVSSLYSK